MGARSIWVKQYNNSFTSLLDIYKKSFYRQCSLVKNSQDVAVCLTLKFQNDKVNFTTAPINKKQLASQVLRFKRNLHHDYALVDIDRFTDNFKNEQKKITKFLRESLSFAQEKATETFNYLFQK